LFAGFGRLCTLRGRPFAAHISKAGIALTAMAAFAACGGTPGGGSSPRPSLNPQAQALAFTQCMRAHGVNVPDPVVNHTGGAGGGGFSVRISDGAGGAAADKTKLKAATTACQKYLPHIGGIGGPTLDPAQAQQLLRFSQCMRSHGIADFPDPGSSGGIDIGGSPGSDLNPSNTRFQAAQNACQHLLPGNGKPMTSQGGAAPVGQSSGQ
jgi:hypothetical protein